MTSTPRRRRFASTLVAGCATLAATLLGVRAFSDVPHGPPFTDSGTSTLSKPPSHSGGASVNSKDEELLLRASHAFNVIAQNAMPAVVSISTIRRVPHRHGMLPGMPPGLGLDDPSIGEEGEDDARLPPSVLPPPGHGRSRKSPFDESGDPAAADPRMLGIGSGILIRKDGLVLTNNHVIEHAEKITVTFDEKHKSKGHVVGTDPKTDLALVQIDGPKRNDYPVISFGDSDQIREGDWAIAIGSPFGLNRSVSFGIISAKGRAQMGILDTEDFIQTDAAINPGSSGGPLLNAKGELVGVNTAIFSQGGGNMGIGFAIPAKIAHEVADSIIANGHVSRGWVGMMAQDLDADLAHYFKVPSSQGALVSEVVPNGPASKASIQNGDVVTEFDHHPIDGASSLKSLVGKSKAGSVIPVGIVREGQAHTIKVSIQEQPGPKEPEPTAQQAGRAAQSHAHPPSFGLAVEDVPQDISHFLHLPSRQGTLVVGVNPGSPAFDAGIGPGDIILSANRVEVHGAHDFTRLTKSIKDQDVAVLYVQRGPTERLYVPVKLNDAEA